VRVGAAKVGVLANAKQVGVSIERSRAVEGTLRHPEGRGQPRG
jgi:hypothetical protein